MRVKAKSVNQNAEMTLPSKPSLNPIFKINIAKGTTDPRVEFILPKSYRKFKRKP